MKNFKEFYRKLTTESRLNFWIITTNIFVVMFTFVLGLFIQYLVANTSAQASRKIAHYDIVDKMYPAYYQLIDSCAFYKDFILLLDKKNESSVQSKLKSYMLSNKDEILNFAMKATRVTGKYKYYFEEDNFNKISTNNGQILLGVIILQSTQGDTYFSKKQFIDFFENRIVSCNFFTVANPNTNISGIAETGYELYTQFKTKPEDAYLAISKLIMIPLVENMKIINDELSFANGKETMDWTSFVSWKSLMAFFIIMLLITIVWLKVCGRIVKKIASSPSDYLDRIKRIEKDCDYYKSQLCIKDIEIGKQNEDIKSKRALISELDNRVEELKSALMKMKK